MANFLMRKRIIVEFAHLHHPIEVHVKQLEKHVKTVFMSNDFPARHYIGMLQSYHGFDLGVTHCLLPASKFAFEDFERIHDLG
jgi:hypothetical protein